MNLLKTGAFALLLSSLAVSCGGDDGGGTVAKPDPITNLTITTATTGDGTVVSVTPSSTGGTSYSVDFGTSASDDVIPTSGPAVEYDYPNMTATYTVTVTASAAGLADVVTTKDVTITFEEPEPSMLIGKWVLLHEAGAMAVGPAADNLTWWSSDLGAVTVRNCLFDDIYEFKEDGSFVNIVGDQTWLEPVFGVDPEACGTPVAPFDGTAAATWTHDETAATLVLEGKGAFLGLAKVANIELTSAADAVDVINYSNVVLSEDANSLSVDVAFANAGGADGVNAYWQFKFAREGSAGAMLDQTDTDMDGVIDANDACPDTAGTEPNGCPPSGIGADPTDDFEGNGNITWVGDAAGLNVAFANPSKTGINTSDTVLEYDDVDGQYANIRFDLNEDKTDKFDLTTKNIFKVKVFVPTPGTAVTEPKQLALKLQDGSSATPWEGQVEVIQTYEYDTWQELTFDFSAYSAEVKFSRVVVQFNSENNFEAVKAYIDDFTYGSN